jgi:hypothetical protein
MGKIIASVVFMVLLVSVLVWCVINAPEGIEGDYSAKVEVAKPDEIENAISNVVSDVRKRDFVLIGVGVTWFPAKNCYSVRAKGITRDRFISLKP